MAHEPGYNIHKAHEIIVGLQTDAPLKRAIMPFGGWRVVAASLESYGYTPDPAIAEIFTRYRKTHNDGVFDAYTRDIRNARSSGIVTGLPDAYGRGRIIGDYRRVALYGVDFLIADKEREKQELDDRHSDEDTIRLREELAEQIRSLKELKEYGVRATVTTSRRRQPPPVRRCNGPTSAISPPSSSRTARRCPPDACRRSGTSTSNATFAPARSPSPRRRRSSTTW